MRFAIMEVKTLRLDVSSRYFVHVASCPYCTRIGDSTRRCSLGAVLMTAARGLADIELDLERVVIVAATVATLGGGR